MSAETKVEKCTNAEASNVSPANAKPYVARSQNSDETEQTENYIKILEWISVIGWVLAIALFFR